MEVTQNTEDICFETGTLLLRYVWRILIGLMGSLSQSVTGLHKAHHDHGHTGALSLSLECNICNVTVLVPRI